MKKYQLGAWTVKDKCTMETKDEIVIEIMDAMQKYVAEGKSIFEHPDLTKEQKLTSIENICGRYCGLSDFLNITMKIEIRDEDDMLFTQQLFNYFHCWEMHLRVEISREQKRKGEAK